jgi:hypothetical protein
MPVESAPRHCLLDWAWILSKRRIPHIAPLLADIVCQAPAHVLRVPAGVSCSPINLRYSAGHMLLQLTHEL